MPRNNVAALRHSPTLRESAMVAMVVIKCPETDREITTGIFIDLLRVHRLIGDAVLRCPHCDQEHRWSMRDAYLSLKVKPTNRPKRR
jgi:hypothetical protein